ncbi:MAG: hypothetical protein JNG85_16080 [Spirochaetaceae bacterium]|nr:hypothetical protein [Spirochaetaceae bacterium]
MTSASAGASLKRRLSGLILATGLVAAGMASLVHALVAYRSETLRLGHELDRAALLYGPAVTEALWVFDESLVRALLGGMVRSPELAWAAVAEEKGIVAEEGERPASERWLRRVPLSRELRGVEQKLGELLLAGDEAAPPRAAVDSLLVTLPVSLGVLFFLALTILGFLSRQVSRPLAEAVAHLEAFDLEKGGGELALGRRRYGDELDILVESFNELGARLRSAYRTRLEAEASLERVLAEREVLVKELYHRTRNNMQVLISLLALEKAGLSDEAAIAAFESIEGRIASMSLVHRLLYESRDLVALDLADYVRERGEEAARRAETQGRSARLRFDLESIETSVDIAIPFGLVLGELLDEAFRNLGQGGRGLVRVSLSRLGDEGAELVVERPGGGGQGGETGGVGGGDAAGDVAGAAAGGFGSEIVAALVAEQLHGRLSRETAGEGGFRSRVGFSLVQYEPRL